MNEYNYYTQYSIRAFTLVSALLEYLAYHCKQQQGVKLLILAHYINDDYGSLEDVCTYKAKMLHIYKLVTKLFVSSF